LTPFIVIAKNTRGFFKLDLQQMSASQQAPEVMSFYAADCCGKNIS
jgi:hypothetical protein